jgi:hypothetical protein
VYGIYVTHRSGVFVANGEAWSVVDGERLRPERVNLLMRTARLARALQAYLQRQGLHRIRAIEPVLVAADPGMHIESVHPIVRVVMSDAVDHFAASLLQVPSVLSNEAAHEVVERILHPRLPQPSQPEAVPAAEAPPVPQKTSPFVNELQPVQDHQKATTWDPSELSFAFEDDSDATPMGGETSVDQLASHETTQSVSSQKPAAKPRRRLNGLQLFVLVCIGMAEICVLVAFAALIFLYR